MREIGALFLLVNFSIPLSGMAPPQNAQPDLVMEAFNLSSAYISSGAPSIARRYLRSEVKVRNVGAKTAYQVDWDYFLTDLSSEKEVAHYYFRAKRLIKPNQKVSLISLLDESRDTEQNRKISEKYAKNRFHERATITLIEYTDGTSWQLPVVHKSAGDAANQPQVQLSQDRKASRPPELKKGETGSDVSQPKVLAIPQVDVEENDILRTDTRLVTVPVIATNSRGAYVTDLKAEEFRVYEDMVEQRIFQFTQVEMPFFVVLLLDTSASTSWTLDKLKREAIAFIDQLKPNDYVFVVTFDTDLHALHQKATNDHKVLRDAIMSARIGGSTSLLDAVMTISGKLLRPIAGRKALILFTDGGENTSVLGSKKNTLHDAEELDALIYVVHYFPFAESGYLKKLVEKTGGRLYSGTDEQKIRRAFTSLAEELRQQYAVSYYPSLPAVPGQTHDVRVIVTRPGVHIKSRKTYKVRS